MKRALPDPLVKTLAELGAVDGVEPIDTALARTLAQIDLERGGSTERAAAVALGAALVSWARRDGHTAVALEAYAGLPFPSKDEAETTRLPSLDAWRAFLTDSPVVGAPGEEAALLLDGDRLALGRFWKAERRVAAAVKARAALDLPNEPSDAAKRAFMALFPEASAQSEPDQQAVATVAALGRKLLLVAGGPGTGKTYTATRILALLTADGVLRDAGAPPLSVALAAPTAKAAQRLGESLREGLSTIPAELGARVPTEAMTLHRLLGYRPSRGFKRSASDPIPHDIVLVDEGSMVDLLLFDALLAALRPEARLIVLGDPDQLASVDAGAVFGDLCEAGAGSPPQGFSSFCGALGISGVAAGAAQSPLDGMAVTLTKSRRFDESSGVGSLARAVLAGDGASARRVLSSEADLQLVESAPTNAAVKWATKRARSVLESTTPQAALDAFNRFRLLAVVRRGPRGVEGLNASIERDIQNQRRERWSAYATPFYNGRPLIVTRNEPDQRLWNGEVGICWQVDGQPVVYFGEEPVPASDSAGTPAAPATRSRLVALARMPPHELAWALTVHKSQGSEFEEVGVVLPEKETRGAAMLARDLLYTAATRSKRHVAVFGGSDLVERAAEVERRRSSGLVEALRA